MSWIRQSDEKKSSTRILVEKIIKEGKIPSHIAIIMDGNRRFARKNGLSSVQMGHSLGFETLANTLEWCSHFGITTVTVYAFSIENYKRSEEELAGLWNIVREKMNRLFQEEGKLREKGVRVRILGNLSLLPKDIQKLVSRAMKMTLNNNQATLNVCLSYTSREEIAQAMKKCAQGVQDGIILSSDIDERVLERCLYTADEHGYNPPQLLIRTSGEVRLSDFLLWQSSFSVLSFVRVLWPEFSVWHFYGVLLHFQSCWGEVSKLLEEHKKNIEELDEREILEIVSRDCIKCCDTELNQKVKDYKEDRQIRLNNFFQWLNRRREETIESMLL
ncbi:unnamed protein product [Dimorphilus gyrociliatus]|uniref:Alkyl transferase n=1 Tax=Dimorphilus gyrociliatus TaxID=2664684 RepID=A0A7I8V6Z1_9ANNE|nr:unnamed protein product [Dimorphilus gyrociliatus]